MPTPNKIVVVGGGLAGAKAVEALREQGFSGALTLVGAESDLPYERPPLSKEYLAGSSEFDEAVVHDEAWYREHEVDLRLGTRVSELDTTAHRVLIDGGGQSLDYDAALLATGSTPRALPVPGADATGVHYLRTRKDSEAIRATFGEGRRLVVVGGGWIGLEVAAAARGAGTDVTVVEVAELPLVGVLGRQIAKVFADLHTANGVDLRCGAQATEILTDGGQVAGVRIGNEIVAADAVVVGIGVTPCVELADAAGLGVEDGVLVDAALRTSDPAICAVGDIANHDHPMLGHRVRVEHWATALNQPAVAAATMLGNPEPYTELPYFFSDQYDLGMEYLGHAPQGSYAQVLVRGDLDGREFVAFWLDDNDRIKAAMNVNVWDVLDEIKPLIAEGKALRPDRLSDPEVPYSDL